MTICLNLIVKNEAAVIARCLASVRPYVDRWVIHDTGSTDGTQDVIRGVMCGIPGRVVDEPWVYQVHNRNLALMDASRAHSTHILLIDADETLDVPAGWRMPTLTADGYDVTVRQGDWEWPRMALIARDGWRWAGKRRHPWMQHERPDSIARETLAGAVFTHHADGHSWSDPLKYAKHVEDMRADLADDPMNPRLTYYLAQSLEDSGRRMPDGPEQDAVRLEAAQLFRVRGGMEGNPQERLGALERAMTLFALLRMPEDARACLSGIVALQGPAGWKARSKFQRAGGG